MPDVRLVDLDMIKRYSLAIRQEAAPAEEVLAALDASRDQVLAVLRPARPTPAPDGPDGPDGPVRPGGPDGPDATEGGARSPRRRPPRAPQ